MPVRLAIAAMIAGYRRLDQARAIRLGELITVLTRVGDKRDRCRERRRWRLRPGTEMPGDGFTDEGAKRVFVHYSSL